MTTNSFLKSWLPPKIYLTLLRNRLERSAKKKFPNNGSVENRVGYVSHKYCLEQAGYFTKQGEWDNRALTAGRNLKLTVPSWLFPWHVPALKEIEEMPKNVRILDICCGIPTFLEALHIAGYKNLFGTEDNSFMPHVVEAAMEYCEISNIPARIFDVRTSYAGDYRSILTAEQPFDVITNFGVATVLYFPIIYDLLREEGIFITETYFESVPIEFKDKFALLRSYSEYGFRLHCFSRCGSVSIFKKIS